MKALKIATAVSSIAMLALVAAPAFAATTSTVNTNTTSTAATGRNLVAGDSNGIGRNSGGNTTVHTGAATSGAETDNLVVTASVVTTSHHGH